MPVDPGVIPSVPTPVPQSSDPVNFPARGDAVMTALPGVVDGMNTSAAATNANALEVLAKTTEIAAQAEVAADPAGYVGKSTTTLTVVAGNKDIVLSAARANLLTANRQVVLVQDSDASIRMWGTIAGSPAPTSTTARVVVTSGGVFGTGSYSSWKVIDAAFFSAAATAAEVLAAVSDNAPVTPKAMKDALGPYVLTDGATVTPSGLNGLDFQWTIGGNRTLGAITNTYPGARGEIEIIQDATGGRVLAWSSVYKRRGGLPVLSAAAAARDYLSYRVKAVDGSGTATRVVVNFDKAPTS